MPECELCGGELAHQPRQTETTAIGTVHLHYRCETDDCAADGGTLLVRDGEITRRLGAALDSSTLTGDAVVIGP